MQEQFKCQHGAKLLSDIIGIDGNVHNIPLLSVKLLPAVYLIIPE
nr:MAG TPA: hypothetical protein [Caudoviricetes sp.]